MLHLTKYSTLSDLSKCSQKVMKMHTYDVLPGYVVYDHNFGLLFKLLYCNLVFSKGLPKGCCGLFMGGLNLGHFVSRFVLGHFLLQTLGSTENICSRCQTSVQCNVQSTKAFF